MEDMLRRERHDEIERLVLNRPSRDNALSAPLIAALKEALTGITVDPTVQLVIITGSGTTFCGQADGAEYFHEAGAARSFMLLVRDLHILMQSVPKPIIAAVNGLARMGGLELALACDLIVASSTAVLGDAHPAGIPGGGASQRLRGAVGTRMARWLLYTGEMLSAQRALEIGLVQHVFDAATFDASVLALARRIVARRMGHSLSRVKALTARGTVSLHDLDFEIDTALAHYFEPAVVDAIPDWGSREKVHR